MLALVPLYSLQKVDSKDGKPKKKLFNKFLFRDLVKSHCIINERHYQETLKLDLELQEAEIHMNPSQLEGYKKILLGHNFRRLSNTFKPPAVTVTENRTKLVMASRFLRTIPMENKMDVCELTVKLTKWYFQMNHKKLDITMLGKTNSGKSLLADLLTLQYKDWHVGTFSCPPGFAVLLR